MKAKGAPELLKFEKVEQKQWLGVFQAFPLKQKDPKSRASQLLMSSDTLYGQLDKEPISQGNALYDKR